MLKRFFRAPLVKIMLLIETAVSIVVMTNLWAVADKYYIGKLAEASGFYYAHVAAFDVGMDIGGLDKAENKPEAKQQAGDFLNDLCGLGGNVSIYPVAGDIGDGGRALYTLYMSVNEELPVAAEGKAKEFSSNSGAYVGNYNADYIKDGVLSVFADRLEVIGIMASSGFDKNEFIYIKYADLSDISRNEAAEYIVSECYSYSNYVTVRAESNSVDEEEYRQRFEEIIGKYPFLIYKDGDTGAVTPAVSTVVIYSSIKYVFLGLSVFMCAGLLFQTMQLYLYNEKDNILIKKIYGMKERQIFLPICAQILMIFVLAIFLAMLVEVIVYHFMERCNLLFIMKSLAAAAAVSAVLELIVLAAAYLKFRLTGMSLVSRLSGAEE
ncbi:MAG: hypothetical protein HDT13_12670 [Butyrivibrio sp.]|nr:hypothetical protein [Butyrivibrio sp.]